MRRGVSFLLTVCCIVLLAGCAKEADKARSDAEPQVTETQATEAVNDITESKDDSIQTESASSDSDSIRSESLQSDSTQSDSIRSENTQTDSIPDGSVQAELAKIEAQSCEYENADWGSMGQQEMNRLTAQWYQLWDEELNLLWSSLRDELSPERKTEMLDEQRAWIKRKEIRVRGAGVEALGGSLQSQLENDTAKDMTRARAYILAGYLADARNESFLIPLEIQESIDMAELDLDDVFATFEGQWIFDEERGACVGIERAESCAYDVAGSKWIVWITGGDILSDQDVYGYTENSIIFKVAHDGYTAFYALNFNIDHALVLSYGTSLDAMDDTLVAD